MDSAAFRIAVDTGGTFTDVVVATSDGTLWSAKALTRFDDAWGSIEEALDVIAPEVDSTTQELLARTSLFSYATTRATNAILTRGTARTAFVTTEGFPDILTLRQGGRLDPFDFDSPFPDPYIPRSLTFELPGRIDSQGDVVRPFDPAVANEIAESLRDRGCEAVAVCLLWSHVNPIHEVDFGAVLTEVAPDVLVTLSHQLNPVIREYPRASSTAIDASLKPLMQSHFAQLEDTLRANGFRGQLLAATSAGGCLPAARVAQRPIYSIDSGPAMAPIAGRAYAEVDADSPNAIVYDTGGTSFDVTLIADGSIATTRDRWLGGEFSGHLLGISSVGVHSIGAGGGSIAWVDDGGLLKVGPQSAGSDPGPACYGGGGTAPTVTDAAAACGYLDPAYFLGGRLRLDVDRARKAIRDDIAQPLNLTMEDAARAILAVADESMVGAIREITVNQGIDPRECLLVAGGGAGGLNVVPIARELGCRRALVPRAAGTLSAVGAQFSDLVTEFATSSVMTTERFDSDQANSILLDLDREMEAFVTDITRQSIEIESVVKSYLVEARYPDQVWDLRVPLTWDDGALDGGIEGTVQAFHDLHQRTFAVSDPQAPIECQQWIGSVKVQLRRPSAEMNLGGDDDSQRPQRDIWFDGKRVKAQFRSGASLVSGERVEGPAVIEETTTTVVLPPGSVAEVTPIGSYLIDV